MVSSASSIGPFRWMQTRYMTTVGVAMKRRLLVIAVFGVSALSRVRALPEFFPEVFCRRKIKGISSRLCNCRTAPPSSGPTRC